jgi:hypothetical protein
MSNGLHRGCVQQVGLILSLTRNRAILKQKQMFDSAFGSGVYNLLDIARELKHLAGGVGAVEQNAKH